MRVKIDMEVFHETRMAQQRINELVRDIGRAVEEGIDSTQSEWIKNDIDSIIDKLKQIKGQL